MNLPKAKELLQLDLDDPGSVPIEDLNQAQEIGIAAINRILLARSYGDKHTLNRLPGED